MKNKNKYCIDALPKIQMYFFLATCLHFVGLGSRSNDACLLKCYYKLARETWLRRRRNNILKKKKCYLSIQ